MLNLIVCEDCLYRISNDSTNADKYIDVVVSLPKYPTRCQNCSKILEQDTYCYAITLTTYRYINKTFWEFKILDIDFLLYKEVIPPTVN